jgi:outer membrane biosynthesis protein TonB
MAAPRSPISIDAELDVQWRAIDGVLNSLAQRSRARRDSGEEEMEAPPVVRAVRPPRPSEAALRRQLEEVTREREELRVQLATAERRLRSARTRLRRLEQATAPATAAAPAASTPDVATQPPAGSGQARWLRVVRRHLRRHRGANRITR